MNDLISVTSTESVDWGVLVKCGCKELVFFKTSIFIFFIVFFRYHMSPLMYACREGRVKVISKLLDNQANINKQDSRGWTVSH